MNKIHPIEPEELMAYLDGELSEERAKVTAAHLGLCPECQGVVAELRGVSQALKSWNIENTESEIPDELATALSEQGEKHKASVIRRWGWRGFLRRQPLLAWAGGLAAVVVLIAGTVRFTGRNENQVFSNAGSAVQGEPATPPRGSGQRQDRAAPDQQVQLPTMRQLVGGLAFSAQDKSSAHSALANISTGGGPMIVHTAELSLTTKEFDKARALLESFGRRHHGYLADLKVTGTTGNGRTLTATLRVPADQLDATLADVKSLGRVESESQGGQDVTSEYVDLQARLANARNTEKRLTDLLVQRTGKLSDVLEVEQELDRVRGDIEQMEAQRKSMAKQVTLASLNVSISEDYQAQLQVVPPSTATKLSNAAVEGYRTMVDGAVSLALFILLAGPSLLLWTAVLFLPARFGWKMLRRRVAE